MGLFHRRKTFPENVTPERAPVVIPPEPKPLTAIGYTFCGWENPRSDWQAVPGVQCPAPEPWKALQTNDREPSQGYYNEADPAVTTERLRQCQAGGIDCVAYQIDLAHEHTQPNLMPKWRPPLASPLIDAHCADNHPEHSPVKHFVSWWDTSANDPLWQEMKLNGWTGAEVIKSHSYFAKEVALRYMQRANYLHVNGKPVLMRGAAENLLFYESEFGLHPKDITDIWRHVIQQTIGTDIYVIATSVDPPARVNLKAWGFDGLTEYLLQADGWDATMKAYDDWWARDLKSCRAQGLDFWIPATVGFNPAAWNQNIPSHMPTPAQFTAHIRKVRQLCADNYDVTHGMYCIYAMTEFGEGGILEAMKPGMLHDGDEMLRAHKAAT